MDLTSSVAELPEHVRRGLAKSFIEDAVIGQYRQLVRWQHITGQSAQIDSGYLGQHLVSLVSGKAGRGRGSRGKGADLDDGSEIKIASTLGGVDKPRWNNKLNTPAAVATYLSNPAIYFGLFDTLTKGEDFPVRVRIWIIEPARDGVFATLSGTGPARRLPATFNSIRRVGPPPTSPPTRAATLNFPSPSKRCSWPSRGWTISKSSTGIPSRAHAHVMAHLTEPRRREPTPRHKAEPLRPEWASS